MYTIQLPLNHDTAVTPPREDPTTHFPGVKLKYKVPTRVDHGGGQYQFGFDNSDPKFATARVIDGAFRSMGRHQTWKKLEQSVDGVHPIPFWVSSWGPPSSDQPFTMHDQPEEAGDYKLLLLVVYDNGNGEKKILVDPEIHNDQPG